MLTVFGSVAIDTIRTPSRVIKNALGGAATYAAISSSFFQKPGLIAVVGNDFPKRYQTVLDKFVDTKGVVHANGQTFRYDGSYDQTLSSRTTNKTELNVLKDFKPIVPEKYRKSEFVYLANNDPAQNTKIIKEFDKVRFSMCDTIDFWISTKRSDVIKMMGVVDSVVINDEEARLLTKTHNLIKAAKKIMEWGTKFVIIKKGEHGSLLFYDDVVFPSPAFSLENIVDPTGAGDSFAGGMIGYLASKKSTKLPIIREAVIYGNVMGSFAVEKYGTAGLVNLNRSRIQSRFNYYKKMVHF
ncbi:MAG TPA: PfkB family carbohydrate kinase [Candidatus Nitrosotalea sp.]|nr:sugar kinase [Nitrososphaerota archaeon]HKU32706.1 PfkB family carbohydrate kinase [Candidatus Nitrosotalea sp.]